MAIPAIHSTNTYKVDPSNHTSDHSERKQKNRRDKEKDESTAEQKDPTNKNHFVGQLEKATNSLGENIFELHRQILDTNKLVELLSKKPSSIKHIARTFRQQSKQSISATPTASKLIDTL